MAEAPQTKEEMPVVACKHCNGTGTSGGPAGPDAYPCPFCTGYSGIGTFAEYTANRRGWSETTNKGDPLAVDGEWRWLITLPDIEGAMAYVINRNAAMERAGQGGWHAAVFIGNRGHQLGSFYGYSSHERAEQACYDHFVLLKDTLAMVAIPESAA